MTLCKHLPCTQMQAIPDFRAGSGRRAHYGQEVRDRRFHPGVGETATFPSSYMADRISRALAITC